MSKVYWNPEDAPYLTQQIPRNIILRWIRRPLPDFEECAACNYTMRRIWNSGQRRRSGSFYSRSAALHIWHATYLYQDFTRNNPRHLKDMRRIQDQVTPHLKAVYEYARIYQSWTPRKVKSMRRIYFTGTKSCIGHGKNVWRYAYGHARFFRCVSQKVPPP